jgi:nucleotide-binding universal stress UspA family protein
MVVMVTHGRAAFGKLVFGSEATDVLPASRLPLLVLH